MRRISWLTVLLLGVACGHTVSDVGAQSSTAESAQPEVAEAQGVDPESAPAQDASPDGGAAEAGPVVREPLPWPEQALPAFKALYTGSWVPDGPDGFDEQWFDEAALVETYTKRRAGRRIWRGLRSSDGVMPLDLLIRDRTGPAVGFVYVLNYRSNADPSVSIESVIYDDEPAILHLRYQGRTRVLFDGEVVLDVPAPPPGELGHAQAEVTMTDGFDVILVKAGRGSPELGSSMNFELRLSDLDGAPIAKQGWNTMRASDARSELVEEPDSEG